MDSFYGNDKAKAALVLGSKDGRLPHAVLFEGESGSGRKTFARLTAAAAVCTGEEKPCGQCRDCRKALEGTHPDVILADGAESAKNLNVDAIRAIRSDASVKPNEAARKVYILADAQNMTVQAQNALLKVLEEPPGGVMFFLTCENRSQLLETIVSRVTVVRIENVPPDQCVMALRELVPGRTEEDYRLAAELYQGNIGRAAASLKDEAFGRVARCAEAVVRAAVCGTEFDLLRELAALESDREGFVACLLRVRSIFLELLKAKYRPETAGENRKQVANQISALQCRRILAIIEEISYRLEQNMGYALASASFCSRVKQALRE